MQRVWNKQERERWNKEYRSAAGNEEDGTRSWECGMRRNEWGGGGPEKGIRIRLIQIV